jgi:hypothetical protein
MIGLGAAAAADAQQVEGLFARPVSTLLVQLNCGDIWAHNSAQIPAQL